ncbi:MAG: AMP-binding protein, partial [Pseudohongiellaceae bacterium]
ADLHGPLRSTALNLVIRHVKKMVPAFHFDQSVSFKKALRLGKRRADGDVALPAAQQQDEALLQLAVLQYTGGTTGVAKGAMLTHANLVSNMMQLYERLRKECPGPGEVMVAPLPLYHIYAFTVHFLYGMHIGLHNLLIPNPRDIPAFVRTMKKYRIAGMAGINTLFNALCGSSEFARLDFSNLKLASAGGMALSLKTYNRWLKLTGCRILEGYGLTETSPLISCNSSQFLQPGTIGKPVMDTEVKVINEQGSSLPPGEPGELCVRGPQVMAGYWRRPEETREVLDDQGWFRTGDVAVIQEDGFLRIVDRIKDLIIVSGYNVYPGEIEEHVCQHPDIVEAAAIGIRRGDSGEKVKLFVVSRNPELLKTDIIEYCRQGLAPYKVPKLIEFRDSLPKSNVGKILRRQLRNI